VARVPVVDADDVALLPDVLDAFSQDALHAASTSGPPSPARSEEHGPGRRICAWPFMRLRPPALHHPREARNTVRAVGSAPGPSCGFDLRPSITRAKRGTRSGPSDLPLALHCSSSPS